MYEKYLIIGNVGRDPEMRYTPSGQAVTSFSVAVNHEYTNSGGEKIKDTKWVRVVTWGKLAENCNQYVKKGMKVLAEGRLNADKETGNPVVFQRKDGTSGSAFEMTAQIVRFLSSSHSDDGGMVEAAQEVGGEPVPF